MCRIDSKITDSDNQFQERGWGWGVETLVRVMKGSLDRRKRVKCQNVCVKISLKVRGDVTDAFLMRSVLDEGEDADRGGGCIVQ